MVKPLSTLAVLVLSLTLTCKSQNKHVNAVLIDSLYSEPISFAFIQNNIAEFQTISNVKGEAHIYYISESDSVFISHIGYKLLKTTVSSLLKSDSLYLQQNEYLLNTVYITSSSPEQILLKALEHTSENLFIPGKTEAYYKEFVKRNGEYVSFADADFTYYVERDKKKDVIVDAKLKASRAYDIPMEKGKYDVDLISPIGYKKTLRLYDPVSIGKFLKPNNMKNYTYSLNIVDDYYIIEIKPRVDIEEALYEGKVKIRISDNSVQSIDYRLAENKVRFAKEVNALIIKVRLLFERIILEYSEYEGQYYPIFIRTEYKLKSYNNKNIDQENTFINDVFLYAISEDQLPINKNEIFKKASVYKNGTHFNEPYWEGKKYLTLTEGEKVIINSMADK